MSSLSVIPERHRRLVARLVQEPVSEFQVLKNPGGRLFICFLWDKHHICNLLRTASYVPMVGTYSKKSKSVTMSKKVKDIRDRILLGFHESIEKYCINHYQLPWAVEAHFVATALERRLAQSMNVDFDDYSWRIEFLWRKGLRSRRHQKMRR